MAWRSNARGSARQRSSSSQGANQASTRLFGSCAARNASQACASGERSRSIEQYPAGTGSSTVRPSMTAGAARAASRNKIGSTATTAKTGRERRK
jgi:hypothetical protein